MFKRYVVLFFLLISLVAPVCAQEEDDDRKGKEEEKEEKNEFRKNLFFGGYLWVQFGTITHVEVAPQAGYHINERLDVGLGLKYMYYNSSSFLGEQFTGTGRFSSHIFGGNVFTDYKLIKDLNKVLPFNINGQLMAHLEYDALNMPSRMNPFGDESAGRFWAHSYFVGGGLRQQLGKGAFMNFFILYNLNHKEYLPYENPVIRIGFGF